MIAKNGEMVLRIDERTDVLASLSLCLRCLRSLNDEPAFWKWAILSLHNALQGAMVCHLSGTSELGALSDKSIKALLNWHERDHRGEIKRIDVGIDKLGFHKFRFATEKDYPPQKCLADAKELFKRLSSKNKRREGAGAVIMIAQSERHSFHRLHDLRNELSHFTPKGWSIEPHELPDIFFDMLSVLEKISADPWPFRHMSEEEHIQLRNLLQQLRAELEKG